MQDQFGRPIEYLRMSVTDLCNYRCQYCMGADGVVKRDHSEVLSIEELIQVGKLAVDCGIKKIRITGGEPLVRKGIIDLCKGLKAIDGLEELSITTNGALLSQYANDLKLAGVDRLNISLDTLKEDRFQEITRLGSLQDVLDGIDAAIATGFSNLKINVVLMGGINDDEIADFVAFTIQKPIHVRFIELMPIGVCKDWEKSRFIPADIVLKKVPELVAVGTDGVSETFRLASVDGVERALGTIGLIRPMTKCFCAKCNRLRVTADGRVLPCLHSDLEYQLKGLSELEQKKVIEQAIQSKPQRHHLNEYCSSNRLDCMHQIGG